MKLTLAIALTLSTLCVGTAFGDTIRFGGPNVTVGHSQVFNPGPNSVTAYAFGGSGKLFEKAGAGSENGLGISGAFDNEISNTTFIQLDLANVSGLISLTIGSTQKTEGFELCSSSTLGTLGVSCHDYATPGSDPFSTAHFSKSARYLSIQADRSGSSILLDGMSVSPAPVPEPGSFFLLGTGIIAAAGAVRRKLSA